MSKESVPRSVFRSEANRDILAKMSDARRTVHQEGFNGRVGALARFGWVLLVASCVETKQVPPPPPQQITVPPVTYEPALARTESSAVPSVPPAELAMTRGPLYAEDLNFLLQYGPVIQLESAEQGVVAVSAKYQGRVMTSAVSQSGTSLGYLNRKFIPASNTGTPFDNYGGEDRFWLGPEGGQFGLYFAKGKPYDLANWRVPASMQEGEWTVAEKSNSSVVFTRTMKVVNHAGTEFEVDVRRTVRVLTNQDVLSQLTSVTTLGPVKWIGFQTVNQITNKGKKAWTKSDGLLSIWILSQLNPAEDMNVVIPFERQAQGEIVNDRYFGVVPSERLHVFADQGFLTFRCDGKLRSKVGLGPARAKGWLGSYSESANLLTLVEYDKPEGAKDYVNSMWEKQKAPYDGDVTNAYNDGPTEPGKESLGGFYEIESSSPAAALAPGKSLTHTHRTLHFIGKRGELDPLAKAALGVSLDRVVEVTKP